jgi:hypothetical protein
LHLGSTSKVPKEIATFVNRTVRVFQGNSKVSCLRGSRNKGTILVQTCKVRYISLTVSIIDGSKEDKTCLNGMTVQIEIWTRIAGTTRDRVRKTVTGARIGHSPICLINRRITVSATTRTITGTKNTIIAGKTEMMINGRIVG